MGKNEKPSAIVMTYGKREIPRRLLSKYDIQTAQDIQEALKDLLGVLNSLKNRGLRDILILCAEGIERRYRDCLSSVNFNVALSTKS